MNLKNIALAGAALSATVFCGAVSADYVESSNVVGYTTTSLEANKFYLVASQFQNVSGEMLDIQSFITSSDMIGGEEDSGPNLKLWDGSGYVDYYYLSEDLDGNSNVWSEDLLFAATDVPVDLGSGAFLKVKNNCTVTVAGQVAAANSLVVPLTAKAFNLVANPFPVSFDLNGNKVDFQSALIGGEEDNGPNLKIWDGNGYVDYYYLAEDLDGNTNVWSEDLLFAADGVKVPAFSGFWLKYMNSEDDVSLLFKK